MKRLILMGCGLLAALQAADRNQPTALDRYIREAIEQPAIQVYGGASPGSLWNPAAPLGNLGADLRAAHVDDVVTILVSERAIASASGDTQTARSSSARAGVASLYGPARTQLADFLSANGQSQLQGQGATSRESLLTTTLAARVTHVLPNGFLVVEGVKETMINSERQTISVRGVVRPVDLSPANSVRSDRLAQLEVRINGKGVVEDAIRRPHFLYRALLGLLPF
ncbi:MAG: flagellar basal body L-ring protein FlgH [Bryobacterales bacterium]|jgi:flagellar L-ring protein FlgH|nr:flagellar basal body L-ring protein FlgH [Bryobacterales bacterium]